MEHLPEHIPPPPQRWDRFLRWYCAESFIDEVQGDLHEQYYRTAEEAGIASARRQFRIQVIRFMRPFRMKHFSELSPFYFQLHMFKHYFTITHRNMWRHRGYSALNILGLSIGMAACMLILHFVDLESSYDHFHISADELYRVQSIGYDNGEEELREACSSHGMGPTLLDRMPEVRGFVRIHPWYTANVITYRDEAGMEKSFFEEKGLYADSNFLDFFNFPLRVGDRSRALQEKKSLLVSVSAAYKYFGSPEEAMGKYLMIGGGRLENEFKVAGVFEDLPQNTHFEFEFLVPMANVLENQQYQNDPGWNWNNFFTYLKASADLDIAAFEKKGSDIVSPLIAEAWDEENYRLVPELIKVKDIHLYSTYVNELTPSGNAYTVYFFGLIGILILLIGWINYINLSTARAISRAKEVGIRKTVGAIKPQLVRQFLFEALFTNLIAAGIAIGLTALTLPYLSEVVGKDLTNIQQSHTSWWWMLAGGLLLGTLLAGLYPALVLSSFRPLAVLKGLKPTGKGGFSLRKVLVVFQFTATVALVAGTVAIYQQLQLMRSEDLGMALDQVMIVKGPRIMPEGSDRLEKKKLFKARLQQIPQVKIAAGGGSIPGGGYNLGSEVTKL
ncbi:MAG: ABC transporter permease, partial [Bacteroidota bacterium]